MTHQVDAYWMRLAIRLSRRGYPAPNPHVGCVLVKDGCVMGQGWHAYAGGPHAEIAALAQAGDEARGATAYVTLEPCDHHGRTPPCTLGLIEAGVRRVVVACADPNPVAAGGAGRLLAAGVEVEMGLLAEEAAKENYVFLGAMHLGRPFVTVKAAVTLDGRIARPDGSSKWITGERARKEGHRLRARMGAVLVGRRTVEVDQPLLTVRGIAGVRNQPVSLVLDPYAKLDASHFEKFEKRYQVVLPEFVASPWQIACPGEEGHLNLPVLLEILFRRGITSILVEGGGRTIRSFLDARLVERIELFMAPKVFGAGMGWLGTGQRPMSHKPELKIVKVRRLAGDIQVSCELQRKTEP